MGCGPRTITAPKRICRIAATTSSVRGAIMAMTTLNLEVLRAFRRWAVAFTVLCLVMGVIQWLVFSRGGGAQNWVYWFAVGGHQRASETLAVVNEAKALRQVDHVWQSLVNAPRNQLFVALGVMNSVDSIYFYGASERVGWWPDVRDWLVFSLGTVVVYLPLLFVAAWLQARRKVRRLLPLQSR